MTLFDQNRLGFPCFAGRVVGPHGSHGTELFSFTVLFDYNWFFLVLCGSSWIHEASAALCQCQMWNGVEGVRISSHAKLRQHPLELVGGVCPKIVRLFGPELLPWAVVEFRVGGGFLTVLVVQLAVGPAPRAALSI